MNLKKFISGVSALTIAASAFAGMAVTASAKYSDDAEKSVITWAPDSTEVSGKQASGWEYNGLKVVTAGSSDWAGNNGSKTYGLAAWNGGASNGNRYIEYKPANTGKLSFGMGYNGTNQYSADTVYVSTTKDASGVVVKNTDGSYTLIANTTYYVVPSTKTTVSSMTYDYTPINAESLTVSYKANGTEVAKDNVTLDANKLVGAKQTFYLPAYVVGKDGLYATGLTNFSKEVVLTGAATTVDVAVTAVDTDYTFIDFDDAFALGHPDQFSNGKVGGDVSSIYTVTEDGIYDVIAVFGVKTNGGSIGNWDDNVLTMTAGDKTAQARYWTTPQTATITGATMHSGDVVSATPYTKNTAYSGVDYILIVKTGDIEETTKDVNYAFTSSVNELKAKDHVYVTVSADGYESSDPVEITSKIQALPVTDSEILLGIKLTMPKELTGVKVVID